MKRPTIFLMLAVVAAVLAAVVVFSALRNREAQMRIAIAQTQKIVVAARDITLGEKLTATDVKLVSWSRQSVPQGAFTDVNAVANAFAKSQLVDGEPVTQRKVIQSDKIPGIMPMIIAPGMRAMSVAVDEVSDIAGFVKPHTRVDILVAVSGDGANARPFSKIVLQNIEVLAVAQQIEKGKDEAEVAKVVTLLVTPHDAEKLGLASREGTLRLAMRNYNDDKVIATAGSDYADLLGNVSSAVALNTANSIVGSPQTHQYRIDRLGSRPFAVEIMRDGKSADTVSFVSGNARHAMVPVEAAAALVPPEMPSTTVVPVPAPVPAAPADAGVTRNAAPVNGAATASYLPVPKTLDLP
jgi:pilus assembly protein CpaB